MTKFPEIKIDPKVEYQRKKDRTREKMVYFDIARIDDVLSSTDESALSMLHRTLDGKYQTCISDWGKSMYGYSKSFGFTYEVLGIESLKDNLTTMRPKLEAYALGWNEPFARDQTESRPSDVSVTVNNTVNISVSFQETKKKIEDMTALSQAQTDEILEKIAELETIQKENSARKAKWEKVKPIIAFVMDKGADVAIALLTLVVQMKLGGE